MSNGNGKIPSKRASTANDATDFNQPRRSRESDIKRFEFCREIVILATFRGQSDGQHVQLERELDAPTSHKDGRHD